jgi:general secretion pathway protein A
MYEDYFNLNDKPFKDSISTKYLYLSKKHLEILESFKNAVEHGAGFLMLTGEVGTGKTSLIKRFVMEIGNDFIIAILTCPDLELIDFFKILAAEFGIGTKIHSKTDFLIGFKEFLHKAHEKGKNVILIIDEAHKLRLNLLDEIRMLSNIKSPNYKMLNIIFVGRTEFNDLILKPQNHALRQRISQNYYLEPLLKDETSELILHRINCAGGSSNIFSADALQSIHRYTSGYPRLIVALCNRALLGGYAKSVRIIEKDIIDECAKDLNIAGFDPINESDEHSEKFSTIKFNIEEPYQNKPDNIICDLRNKIKSQKHQKSVKVKKWQLSLACGILIVLTSAGAYFVKEIINTEPTVLSEKQKMIQIVKNYSIDKDSRLHFNDSNRNVLKANEALAEKKKSSSDVIPSVSKTLV